MRFSEDVLIKIFEKSFDDEVENIYSRGTLISFDGEEYSMEYNFLYGYIAFLVDWTMIELELFFYIVDLTYFSKLVHQPLLDIMLDFSNMNSKSL